MTKPQKTQYRADCNLCVTLTLISHNTAKCFFPKNDHFWVILRLDLRRIKDETRDTVVDSKWINIVSFSFVSGRYVVFLTSKNESVIFVSNEIAVLRVFFFPVGKKKRRLFSLKKKMAVSRTNENCLCPAIKFLIFPLDI